jgi:hypothetical protein
MFYLLTFWARFAPSAFPAFIGKAGEAAGREQGFEQGLIAGLLVLGGAEFLRELAQPDCLHLVR